MASDTDRDSTDVQSRSETGDDPRVLDLVKEYQAELESGSRPDRARYLTRHPELAGVVAECLDGLDLVYRGAKALTGTGTPALRLETGLKAGDRLGEFEIVREVGRGGMGVVYEARQPSLNRRVALKVLPASLAADRKRLQRFTVEAQAAAAVAHPNIVPVYVVGEGRGVHYYAMRLVDGSALDSLAGGIGLLRNRSGGEPRPADFAPADDEIPPPGRLVDLARWDRPAYRRAVARVGALVARALDHAHQSGVVHRDVKPANLLLDRDGHVWVTDFGLAQFTDGGSVTQTGATVGTLRYMSPEQASGDRRRLDHRTDVYSLAATLYELLVGVPAFPAEEPLTLLRQIAHEDPPAPRSVDPAVPIDLETVLLKAMQKEPRDRYATAADLADDLERFLAGRPILARRPWAWDRAKKWAGRHPAVVAAVLVSLVVVGAAGGIASAIVAAEHDQTRQAYRAEQQRADEAERRFRQAKKLGDSVLRISEEEIGSDSPFQGPRRRLLLAALESYKDMLATGHDDPEVLKELDRILLQIETLLADQAEAREAEAAGWLGVPDVQAELQLSPEQVDRINRVTAMRGSAVAPPPRPGGGPPLPGDRGLDSGTRRELIRLLSPPQRHRLRQIDIQLRGPMAFNDPAVIESLNLTHDQRQQIRTLHTELFTGFRPGFGPPRGGPGGPGGGPGGKGGGKGGKGGGGPPKDGPGGFPGGPFRLDPEAPAKVTERIVTEVLTPEQRDAWRTLTGKPFTLPPPDRAGRGEKAD